MILSFALALRAGFSGCELFIGNRLQEKDTAHAFLSSAWLGTGNRPWSSNKGKQPVSSLGGYRTRFASIIANSLVEFSGFNQVSIIRLASHAIYVFRACRLCTFQSIGYFFMRNFVFCKYTKCYRKCKCPAGKKHTRAAALSHIHTFKSCHKITLGLCQIAAHTSEKNIRYDIICSFTVDLQ